MWGWRGWLLPRLMEFGTWAALLHSGPIWGVWHAPLTCSATTTATRPLGGGRCSPGSARCSGC
ncbi:CPBP family glutamic-type intramembrane protease [Saccharopolyspora sp. NPDC000995]